MKFKTTVRYYYTPVRVATLPQSAWHSPPHPSRIRMAKIWNADNTVSY